MDDSEDNPRPAKDLTPPEKFFRYFQHEVTDIQDLISRLSNTSTTGGERGDAVDHCLASIARLSQEVKDASSYIPAYDQRTYGEAIKALGTKLQEARAGFEPRKKFSFKSRGRGEGMAKQGERRESMFTAKKNESAISLQDAAELASERRRQGRGYVDGHRDDESESSFATTPAGLHSPAPEATDSNGGKDLSPADLARIRQPSFSGSTSVTIANHDSMHVILPISAAQATSSGTLNMLTRCIVDMSKPTSSSTSSSGKGRAFQTLTLKNIKDSLLICGHVHGAAHLTNITNSVIVVASRQFRMHNSRDCDVYLLATSRPIVEDCSRIRFAPLPERYEIAEDEGVENQWRNVDDFKWLRAEPSPNWSVLPEEKRIGEKVWKEVVPGGPSLGVEEILTAVGLPG
jgi:hypothetical protein